MKNILALALILSLAFTSLAQQPGFQLSPVTPYGNPSVEPSLWYHLGDDSQGSYIMHKASTNTQQVEIDVLNTDKSFYKRLQIKFFKNKKISFRISVCRGDTNHYRTAPNHMGIWYS